MNDPTKKVSEEELEKQYADYRAQFEHWKETNKFVIEIKIGYYQNQIIKLIFSRGSVGTEAYNQYVSQFEQWEKEVTARKAQTRKVMDIEAEAAAAYAQSQEAYVSHHLKAMEQAEMHQRAAAAAAAAAVAAQQQQHMMQSMMMRQTAEPAAPISERDLFLRTMMEGSGGYHGDQPLPQLWGNSRAPYDGRDPLYAKWGDRAAPTHIKPEATNKPVNPVACWALLDALREKKMVLAPHSSNCPPPPFHGGPPPPL
ncbi:hypothetical protein B9Z55_008197 [Caenorhabditis nigoni]|nr:hypothetical protein B9Z55_008197 [Caenorhabditis nigoni]